ncbi:hypothetical protein T11_18520 [Trichinella zimbabwensis]|uniref:Uncharacterized protein n=1 Tax=Trichinella zimbabwensis TaxID=268475 RepID=A0A0V1HQU1_9BILA|nr:hypothetical protein T11_18520 [Trichinella zimbabwensis]
MITGVVDLANVPREEWMGLPWEEFFSRFSKDTELRNMASSDSEADDEHFTVPSDLVNLPIMDLPPFRNFPGPKEYFLHECRLCGYYIHSSALKRHLGIRHGDTFKEIYGKNNANLNNLTEENKTDITIATALSNSEENNLNKDANEKQVEAIEEAGSNDAVVKKKTPSSRDRNRKSTPRAAPSKKAASKSNSGRKRKTDTSHPSAESQLEISNNDEAFSDKGESVLESTNLAEEQLSDDNQTPAVVNVQNSNVGKKIRKAAAVHEKTAKASVTNVDTHAAAVKCDNVQPTKTRKRKKEQQRAGRKKVSTNKTTTKLGNLNENEVNAEIKNEDELQHNEQQSLQQQQQQEQQEQSSEIVLQQQQQQQQANLRPRIIKLFPSPELLSSTGGGTVLRPPGLMHSSTMRQNFLAVGSSSTSSTTALANISNSSSSNAGLEYYQVSPTYRNGVPFFAFRRISPTAANSQQQAGNIVGLQCGSLLSLAAGQIPPAANNQSNETSIIRSNAVANAENCDTTVSSMLLGLQAATSARITSSVASADTAAVRRVDSLDGLQLD